MNRRLGITPLLLALLASTVVSTRGDQLTLGINRRTGNLIATDIWNQSQYDEMRKDSGRQPDEQRGGLSNEVGQWHYSAIFVLGHTLELAASGTNVQITTLIGFYSLAEYNDYKRFLGHLWVEAFMDKKLIGSAYYGRALGHPSHESDHQPVSLVKVEPLHREKTKGGELLWILKATYTIELQQPVDFIPDLRCDLEMLASRLSFGIPGTRNQPHVPELKRAVSTAAPVITNNATSKLVVRTTPAAKPAPDNSPDSTLPEIKLSITKQDGCLLLTFTPAVAGAKLQEADASASPWVWQPATGVTNATSNGWQVIPTLTPRVFRVCFDR